MIQTFIPFESVLRTWAGGLQAGASDGPGIAAQSGPGAGVLGLASVVGLGPGRGPAWTAGLLASPGFAGLIVSATLSAVRYFAATRARSAGVTL